MNQKLLIATVIIGVLLVVTLGVLLLAKGEPGPYGSAQRLDQLNIQTQNPQPAGKNITENQSTINNHTTYAFGAVWFKNEHRKRAVRFGTVSAEHSFWAEMCQMRRL